MKKITLLCIIAMMGAYVNAAELYTVWTSSNKTITFYYDNNRSTRTGDKVELITSSSYHWGQYSSIAEKMVLTSSMQNYAPTSLEDFFVGGGGYYFMTAVKQITGLNYLNTSNATSLSHLFFGMESLQSVDLSTFNMSNVSSMNGMFADCLSLRTITLGSAFSNCPNLKYASDLFDGCESLTSFSFNNFDVSHLESFYSMFSGCTNLRTITFPNNFSTISAKSFQSMFQGCTNLTAIDLSKFTFNTNVDAMSMFQDCSSLTTITCSKDLTQIIGSWGTLMFEGCTSLRGNHGTQYSSSYTDKTYARPDGGILSPGYFTSNNPYTPWDGNLALLNESHSPVTIPTGMTLYGTLNEDVVLIVAPNAVVTLNGVTINGDNANVTNGLRCDGSATIVLKGKNKIINTRGLCIYVPKDRTLTIQEQGSGSMEMSSIYSAALGGYTSDTPGGNITITGGTITAVGGTNSAAIGTGNSGKCGNIKITGGTVTLTGGSACPAIGPGPGGTCGTITVTKDVTKLTAYAGEDSPHSIGLGYYPGTCGTILIGDQSYPNGIDYSPFVYPNPEGIETTPSDSPSRGEKILRDGQLLIVVGDKMYDARGAEVK